MTFGEKIKDARKHKQLTQKQLAGLIGAAHNSVSDWENDKNKPDPDTIELICGVLDIAPNYLLGKDEDSVTPFDKKLLQNFHESLDEHGRSTVLYIMESEMRRTAKERELKGEIKKLETEISEEFIPRRIFAYYGKIAAAGTSYGFGDVIAGTKEYPLNEINENADYTIGVSGNSMEPTFFDGDIVYVKKVDYRLNVGDIGIFQKDNGIYIKRVSEDGLISDNASYKPMINGGDVVCLGKVLGKAEES